MQGRVGSSPMSSSFSKERARASVPEELRCFLGHLAQPAWQTSVP
ncbi:MAG TPA: hypothetical protein VFU32_06045 [Ktedonobacterales bacterium]|nr:hypothetical protein [Ktedonobacterales bacterium]